jgi:LIVCS family branched-chain amino acid:cation transporter
MAISLYKGNYHHFFARLGQIPGFLMITFLIIIIGPLAAMPRTEATTFHTLLPFLPTFLKNNAVFSLIYCLIVYLLAYRETKVVTILGLFLSPIKIISFTCLIIIGLIYAEPPSLSALTVIQAFQKASLTGYNTMDLLATFFFCAVAFKAIEQSVQQNTSFNPTMMTLKACIIGATLIGVIYLGFMWVAYNHAAALHGLPEEQMISAISTIVLGKFGGFFVCISISFACIATALALADVCSIYLHKEVFNQKISYRFCLTIIIFITYCISNVGFQGILNFSAPILNIIYPALIVLCIFNILHKTKGIKMVKLPVLLTILITTGFLYIKPLL